MWIWFSDMENNYRNVLVNKLKIFAWLFCVDGTLGWTLKTLFNIVEERLKKWLNFDVSAV